MDNIKEGGFVNRPMILDVTNYDYQKAHMISFFKSIDSKTLKDVINGWKPPPIKVDDDSKFMKLEKDWEPTEDEVAFGNSRALIQ